MDEEDGIGWEVFKTIDQVHLHPGDGGRGWDRMIRLDIFKQLTKLTYILKRIGLSDEGIRTIDHLKFTYTLDTEEDDGMGWSDEGYSNNLLSARTS
jgi:hypothetical protein